MKTGAANVAMTGAATGMTGSRRARHGNHVNWVWPGGKRIAVVFNVCLEAWSDGKAPGISPMGNPLPAGVLDTMAISWAAYGSGAAFIACSKALPRTGRRRASWSMP